METTTWISTHLVQFTVSPTLPLGLKVGGYTVSARDRQMLRRWKKRKRRRRNRKKTNDKVDEAHTAM